MKKLITIILILALLLPAAALADYQLSANEQNYVGAWTMYAHGNNGNLYVFIITFLDNLEVIQRAMTFKHGVLTADNKATGDWVEFTDRTIIFSLAGTDMTAMIKE